MQTSYWLKNSQKRDYPFYHESFFFLKTSFISALMIVVNLLLFSSIHCCFVYLHFQWICLWLISNLKEVVIFFVLFVLNLLAFVYNGLIKSLILQQKPNHRILMFILKMHLVLFGYEFAATFITFVCISYFALQICTNLSRETFLVSQEKKLTFVYFIETTIYESSIF